MAQTVTLPNPKKYRGLSTFYTIIITQTLSLIGSRVSSLAFGIWIFTETGQATPLALTSFFTALPAVFAGSISGVLADRWDRRYVMALADTGQAIGTGLLLLSFASGNFVLWHLYAVALFQAIFGVFQTPAFNASVTMLIPDDQRVRANAIRQLTAPSASVIAPLIATFVFATIGLVGAILLDLATFFVAVAVILYVHIPMPEETAVGRALRGSIWHEMWGGIRYLLDRRPLFYMIGYYALVNFFLTGATIFTIPYLLARTSNNEAALGILLAIVNGGAVLGSILIAYLNLKNNRVRYIVICAIVTGVMLSLAGMSRTFWALALTEFFVMLPIPIGNALFISILQAKVPPDVQGRVFAVMSQVVRLLMPVAFLIAGPLADHILEPSLTVPQWGISTPLTGELFPVIFHAPGLDLFAPLVGFQSGAGMGLIMVINGLMLVVLALALNLREDVRTIETTLEDYRAVSSKPSP
ncbi:MAG: MFS transporter [Aggregatilineales bacterium]